MPRSLGVLGPRRGLLFLFCQWRRSGLLGLVGLVFVEPAFEEGDGGEEVVAFGGEQVESGDGDGNGQVVTNSAQQIGVNVVFLRL